MPCKGSGSGTVVVWQGYVRIKRRGPYRDWYEHRKVMWEACREWCYYPVNGSLPEGMVVEHLDHNRKHNCLSNLVLMDKRIHDYLSSWTKNYLASFPAWVITEETGEGAWEDGRM